MAARRYDPFLFLVFNTVSLAVMDLPGIVMEDFASSELQFWRILT
jgi:hypothetical protein